MYKYRIKYKDIKGNIRYINVKAGTLWEAFSAFENADFGQYLGYKTLNDDSNE